MKTEKQNFRAKEICTEMSLIIWERFTWNKPITINLKTLFLVFQDINDVMYYRLSGQLFQTDTLQRSSSFSREPHKQLVLITEWQLTTQSLALWKQRN